MEPDVASVHIVQYSIKVLYFLNNFVVPLMPPDNQNPDENNSDDSEVIFPDNQTEEGEESENLTEMYIEEMYDYLTDNYNDEVYDDSDTRDYSEETSSTTMDFNKEINVKVPGNIKGHP